MNGGATAFQSFQPPGMSLFGSAQNCTVNINYDLVTLMCLMIIEMWNFQRMLSFSSVYVCHSLVSWNCSLFAYL